MSRGLLRPPVDAGLLGLRILFLLVLGELRAIIDETFSGVAARICVARTTADGFLGELGVEGLVTGGALYLLGVAHAADSPRWESDCGSISSRSSFARL